MLKNNLKANIFAPKRIRTKIPLSHGLNKKVQQDRKEIENIISGTDARKLFIVGPCSAWPNSAVIKYAKKLKKLSEKVEEKIKMVMRVYTQKPRTTIGWAGPLIRPNPFSCADVQGGIENCRKMMIDVLKVELPIADEALFLDSGEYFNDLYSYVALGARSAEDYEHRTYASALPFAVGVKNPTSGDLEITANSVLAVCSSHDFLYNQKQIHSEGNKFAHVILRGGKSGSNLDVQSITKMAELLKEKNTNSSIIIDLSHDNCVDVATGRKDHQLQMENLSELSGTMKNNKKSKDVVKGFMIESFLLEGFQKLSETDEKSICMDGLSVTDPCLSWEQTEKMILEFVDII